MAAINPFILANRGGIPRLESVSVSASATAVTFSLRRHPFLSSPFSGLLILRLSAVPEGAAGTLPVYLETNGTAKALTSFGGAAVTASDLPGEGIYLAYYESGSGELSLVTGIV